MSLRARLLLGMAVTAVVLVLSALVIAGTTRAHLIDQVDAQLRAAQPQLRSLLRPGEPPTGAPTPQLSDLYVGVVGPQGVLTTVHAPDLRGGDAPLPVVDVGDVARLRSGAAATVDSDRDGSRYRLLARSETQAGRMVVLGLSLDDVDGAVRRLVAVEALAVLSVLAVLGLVTWWVIRLGVRPIREMTATAGAIAKGDLTHRIAPEAAGTEAGALGDALNAMLEHIERAFAQRAASEERLRQFVADASHELRTPVTTIRGYAELYRSGGLDDATELSEAMRRTEQEAVRMGGLVEDLLRLARLDEGRPLERSPVDLSVIGADAVRDAQAAFPDRQITLVAAEPVMVDGDQDGLRQVVANLLTNAIVHAPDAAITVTVTTTSAQAVLEVGDDGPGMREEDAARAFERFYRADAARGRHRGGSGLGLSLVETIVRAHGGRAEITSSPGNGTTVRVELPLRAVAVPSSG